MDSTRDFLTPPQAAELLGVNPEKITLWIRKGELIASNLAADPLGQRPRYRIRLSDLDAFLLSRAASPPPKRSRRKRKPTNVVEFYK